MANIKIQSKFIVVDTLQIFLGSDYLDSTSDTTTASNGYVNNIPYNSVVFIKDKGILWSHGKYFGTNISSIVGPTAIGSVAVPIYWTGSAFATVQATFGNSSTGEHNANNIKSNGMWYYSSNGPSTALGASTADGALYSQAYSTSWTAQIAQDYRNGSLFVRGLNNGTWSSWKAVLDNINRHAVYGTKESTSYIKIKINSTDTWMLSFMVRVYQGYNHYDIIFSGYNYGSNYWYSPQAILSSSTTTSIVVYFGYESANNLFVVITGGDYTGVEILNVTNGYTQITDKLVISNLFTITNSSSLPTTIQKTDSSGKLQNVCNSSTGAITIYRPWLRNETVTNATNADTLDGIHASGLFTVFSGGGISSSGNTLTQADHSITIGGTNKTAGSSTANIINSLSVSKLTSTSTTNLTVGITINGVASADATLTDLCARSLGQTSITDLKTFTHTTDLIYSSAGGSNSVADKPTGVDAFGVLSFKTAAGWYGQLLMSSNTSSGIYWRTSTSLSGGWRTILDSNNSSVSSTANSITVKINGTTATLTNTNTDTKVTQSQTTTSSWRPVILGYQADSKSAAALYTNVTNVVYSTNVLQYQPSTGILSTKILDLTETTNAPMTVASSALVSNLNADLLDGYHASDFATSAHNHTFVLGTTTITTNGETYTSITGPFNINTGSAANAFSVSRSSASERVNHWVDDSTYYIEYTNDETANSIAFRFINTDTESPHSPSQASNTTIYLNSSRQFYPGTNNTGSIGISSYKWANMYATTFHGDLDGNATTSTYASNVGSSSSSVTAAKVIATCNWYDSVTGTDSDDIINKWSEIVSFVDGFNESDNLMDYLSDHYDALIIPVAYNLTTIADGTVANIVAAYNNHRPVYVLFTTSDSETFMIACKSVINEAAAIFYDVRTGVEYDIIIANSDGDDLILVATINYITDDNISSYLSGYLPLSGGTMTGTIKRTYSAASTSPMFSLVGGNNDVWLWRIGYSSHDLRAADYGFGLKYIGTGSANNNALALYADALQGTQVESLRILQDGSILLPKSVTFTGAASAADSTTYGINFTSSSATAHIGLSTGGSFGFYTSGTIKLRPNGATSDASGNGSLTLSNSGATLLEVLTAEGFKKSGGTSSQFLKADGSVDSNTYQTLIEIIDLT